MLLPTKKKMMISFLVGKDMVWNFGAFCDAMRVIISLDTFLALNYSINI